jgi:hypothetical protein
VAGRGRGRKAIWKLKTANVKLSSESGRGKNCIKSIKIQSNRLISSHYRFSSRFLIKNFLKFCTVNVGWGKGGRRAKCLPSQLRGSYRRFDLKNTFFLSPTQHNQQKKGTQKSNKTLMLYLAICCYFFCTESERS